MSSLPPYSIDTHVLYWRRLASPQLSTAAAGVYQDAIEGKALLIVSHVALAELFYLLQKYGQLPLFGSLLHDLKTFPYYRIEPILLADIEELGNYPEIPEMHDRLLAISAKRLGATLVTRDRTFQASPQVKWLW